MRANEGETKVEQGHQSGQEKEGENENGKGMG